MRMPSRDKLNRTNETFESSTGSAIPRVIFSDDDLAWKGMQAASDFLSGSTVIDKNGVFEAVMDDIVSLPVQTIAHISKSVRPLLAEVLMNEPRHAQYGGIWGFVRLFAFAKATLRLPPRGGRRKRCVVSSLISSPLRRWQSGDLVSLWVEARADANANPSLSSPDQTQDCSQRNARKALGHAREGKSGSAIRILGSNGCVAHDDTSALEDLRCRHPSRDLPPWSDNLPPPLVVDTAAVFAGLRSFPKGTSPGSSKLRVQHLLDVITGTISSFAGACLDQSTYLMNKMLSGNLTGELLHGFVELPLLL